MTPITKNPARFHHTLCRKPQFLFLKTLLPVAGSATTTFFPCALTAVALLFIALAFGAGGSALFEAAPLTAARSPVPAFLITVVELVPLPLLLVLCALADLAVAGRGGGSIFPALAIVEDTTAAAFSWDAVRVNFAPVAFPLRLACSIMPWKEAVIADVAAEAAVFNGDAGFRGETGRAMHDGFNGDDGPVL